MYTCKDVETLEFTVRLDSDQGLHMHTSYGFHSTNV